METTNQNEKQMKFSEVLNKAIEDAKTEVKSNILENNEEITARKGVIKGVVFALGIKFLIDKGFNPSDEIKIAFDDYIDIGFDECLAQSNEIISPKEFDEEAFNKYFETSEKMLKCIFKTELEEEE